MKYLYVLFSFICVFCMQVRAYIHTSSCAGGSPKGPCTSIYSISLGPDPAIWEPLLRPKYVRYIGAWTLKEDEFSLKLEV